MVSEQFAIIIRSMKTFGHLVWGLFFLGAAHAVTIVPNLPNEGVMEPDNRSAIDPNVDYEHFSGRVSDKDDSAQCLEAGLNDIVFKPLEQDALHACVLRCWRLPR